LLPANLRVQCLAGQLMKKERRLIREKLGFGWVSQVEPATATQTAIGGTSQTEQALVLLSKFLLRLGDYAAASSRFRDSGRGHRHSTLIEDCRGSVGTEQLCLCWRRGAQNVFPIQSFQT